MMRAAGGVFIFVALLVGGLLCAGACVWGLLGLLLMKEISGGEFALYAGIFLGLVFLGMVGAPPFGHLGLVLAIALAIGFPIMRHFANERALARMERDDINRYKAAIAKRPEIPYPYKRLAEIHFKRGHYAESAEWYQKYLALSNDKEAEFRIKRALELMQRAQQRPKLCPECRHENSSDARYCVNCGAILPGVWEIIQAFRGKQGARYLLATLGISLAAGIVLGVVLQLSYIYAMLCFWIAAAALVYYLYKRATAV